MNGEPTPTLWRDRGGYGEAPHSIPVLMPDREEKPETLLVDPRGKPLLIRAPRPLGFRPERAR
jgi:hypothetical protein